MVTCVFTLLVIQDPSSDANWKELAMATIRRLPADSRALIEHVQANELYVVRDKSIAGAVFVRTDTAKSVGLDIMFRTRDDSFASLRIALEPESDPSKEYAVESAKARTIEIARSLRPYYAAWKVTSTRVGTLDIYVQCSPMIGNIRSSESLHCYFRKSDGKFFHVNGTVPLDYSRPFAKLITKEQAIQNAWSAYYRYQPFTVSRLSYSVLLLSTYTQHADMAASGTELTENELELARNFVAVPLYIVGIDQGLARGSIQTITVDALTGKVKTIWEAGGPIAGGAPNKDKVVGKEEIELSIGGVKGTATLDKDFKPVKSIPIAWKVVPVATASDNYAARLDPEGRFWIANQDGWHCYRLSHDLGKAAKGAVVTGPKFGAPK